MSQAKYYSARFNPRTSSEDKETLAIIQRLEAEGWNFKQIVQDAILRVQGFTPEMFAGQTTNVDLESLLEMVANRILERIGDVRAQPQADEPEELTEFARQFAQSYQQRNRRKGT